MSIPTDHLLTCSAPSPAPTAKGTLYVAPDGTAYRAEGRCVALYGTWQEKYAVLTVDGYSTVRYELPDGSRPVWTPPTDDAEVDEPDTERHNLASRT